MKKLRYKFLREMDGKIKSESGDCTWKIGEPKKHDGKLDMCHSGFHCSKGIYQAFLFVQGEILAQVEVSGKSEIQDDKEVYSEMKIVKAWKWQKKDSVALSIYAAELCLKNFEKEYPNDKRPREAIEAAKLFLEGKISQEKLEAAKSAAESAAESAESAAWSAESAKSAAESAWSAARSAWSAELAAWSAESAKSAAESAWSAWSAESAARSAWSAWSAESAARSAIIKKISTWFDKHLKELEEIK